MLDLLWRVRFRRKLWPRQATGDTTYGTVENIVALEDEGIRAYIPLPDMNHRRPFYGQDEFAYDVLLDQYRCPEGHMLGRERIKHTEEVIVYRADATTCNVCLLKAQCTESNRGRILQRSLYAEYLDRVRAYHKTEEYKKSMRKRQVWVEPLFAEAKLWHGLRRFRRRGLENVNIEGLLIAAGQNLKRLLAATEWGASSCAVWASPGPPEETAEALSRLWVMTDPAATQGAGELNLPWRTQARPATRGFFNSLAHYRNQCAS